MKTAKHIVLVAAALCPHCDANLKAPCDDRDTYDWTPDTMPNGVASVVCDDCGQRVRIPTIRFS